MNRTRLFCVAFLMVASIATSIGCRPTRTEPASRSGAGISASTGEVQQVPINGTTQALYMPQVRTGLPVILWLNGSPGASEIGLVRQHLQPLHKHFNIVGWDQRGTGQSAKAVADPTLVKVDDYVKDVIAVSEYLCRRFRQDRIYLVGRDWGSILGTKAIQQRPELFAALVSVSPRINTRETDRQVYEAVREAALRSGDHSVAKTLDGNGPPPYTAREPGKYPYLFRAAADYLPRTPQTQALQLRNHFSAFDSSLDRVGSTRGAGMDYLYPQLANLDLEKQANTLEVPVFFVVGRWDFLTPLAISQRYYNALQAPSKDLQVFQESSHYACYEQPDEFTAYMVNTVLKSTRASSPR